MSKVLKIDISDKGHWKKLFTKHEAKYSKYLHPTGVKISE